MFDEYKTIAEKSEGIFREKGSKFLAFAFPVETEDEISVFRAELRKKYFDARHHVYAFQLGVENQVYRASDDGEPSNSSGPPVLGQIRSYGLTNILIVVVRYFGGTKLGIPGLINAYKSAAKNALDNAKIVEKKVVMAVKIGFSYQSLNEVMKILKTDGVKIKNQVFDNQCLIELNINKSNFEQITEQLTKVETVNFF